MKSAKKASLKSEFTLSKRSSRRSTAQCENFKLGLTEVPPRSPWILTFLIFYLKVNYKVSSLRDNDSKQKKYFQLSRDFSKCKISVLGPGFTSDVTPLTYWSKLSKCFFMLQIIYLDAEEVDGFSGYESFMTYSIFILFIIFILGNGQIFIVEGRMCTLELETCENLWLEMTRTQSEHMKAFIIYLATMAS